jgi:hypothetical protein
MFCDFLEKRLTAKANETGSLTFASGWPYNAGTRFPAQNRRIARSRNSPRKHPPARIAAAALQRMPTDPGFVREQPGRLDALGGQSMSGTFYDVWQWIKDLWQWLKDNDSPNWFVTGFSLIASPVLVWVPSKPVGSEIIMGPIFWRKGPIQSKCKRPDPVFSPPSDISGTRLGFKISETPEAHERPPTPRYCYRARVTASAGRPSLPAKSRGNGDRIIRGNTGSIVSPRPRAARRQAFGATARYTASMGASVSRDTRNDLPALPSGSGDIYRLVLDYCRLEL